MIPIKNRTVPCNPRSKNYAKGTVVNVSGGSASSSSAISVTRDMIISLLRDTDGVIRLDAHIALTGGLINFADLGTINLPSLYDAIPVDGTTIGRDASGALTVLGGVGLDTAEMWAALSAPTNEQIAGSHLSNALAGYALKTEIPSLSGYALKSEIPSLAGYATESYVTARFAEFIGSAPEALDTVYELAAALQGNTGSINDIMTSLGTKWTQDNTKIAAWDNAVTLAHTHANKTVIDGITSALISNWNTAAGWGNHASAGYMHLAGTETVSGEKNFTGGLKVNGQPIVYNAAGGYWQLNGSLVLSGGLVTFANLGDVNIPSIYANLPIDGVSIKRDANGVLYAVGGAGGVGTVTAISVNGSTYNPVNGIVSLPNYALAGHVHNFADINNKPSTLSGYGITDALLKSDINVQVGGTKNSQMSWASWNNSDVYGGAIQIREYGYVDHTQSDWHYSPAITFHWGNRYAKRFGMRYDGQFAIDDNPILWSGNYSAYALPLSGGTWTGELTLSIAGLTADNFIKFKNDNQNCYFGIRNPYGSYGLTFVSPDGTYNKVWHSGNDGAGSGLDADLWRGYTPENINVASATKLSTNRTNWADTGIIDNVVGQLAWRNYGNSHTIFDASNGYTPNGTACDRENAAVGWSATYPTLMGYNGSQTYGVRVDSSRMADKLRTSRSIWGQSFDGTGNVDGECIITHNAENAGIRIHNNSDTYSRIRFNDTSGNFATIHAFSEGVYLYNGEKSINIDTAAISLGHWNEPVLYVKTAAKNVGINTTNPQSALDIGSGSLSLRSFANRAANTGEAFEIGYSEGGVLQSYDRTASVYKPIYYNASQHIFSNDIYVGSANNPRSVVTRYIQGYDGTTLSLNPWGGDVSIGEIGANGYKLNVAGNGFFRGTLGTTSTLSVKGTTAFDSMARLNITNGSADYGRAQLRITGRLQDSNDAWSISSGRNNIIFGVNANNSNVGIGEDGVDKMAIQYHMVTNQLGIVSESSPNSPIASISQTGAAIFNSLGIANTSPSSGKGLSLFNGATDGKPSYGLFFGGTYTFGTHGTVTGDWATYFTMEGPLNRGWIFQSNYGNAASISAGGNAKFNGILRVDSYISTGEAADDAYGWINVTRSASIESASYFSMVRAGNAAMGFGINTNNAILIGGAGASKTIVDTYLSLHADHVTTTKPFSSSNRIFTGYDSGQANSISCSNWFLSNGVTGWYNATYGGGITMIDADQVRVHNNKVFYNDGVRAWGINGHNVGLKLYSQDHVGINLANSSYTWGIYSNGNGNLYIGRRTGNVNDTSGSYRLTIGYDQLSYEGSIILYGGGLVTFQSDMRLKTNIHGFDATLDQLAALPIFTHEWRDGTPGVYMSTSAQAVRDLMPCNVQQGKDGYLVMDGTRTALAVAIRLAQIYAAEQAKLTRWQDAKDKQIEQLQETVRELSNRVYNLENR